MAGLPKKQVINPHEGAAGIPVGAFVLFTTPAPFSTDQIFH